MDFHQPRPSLIWIIMSMVVALVIIQSTTYLASLGMLWFFYQVGLNVSFDIIAPAAFLFGLMNALIAYLWLRSIGVRRATRRNS